MKTFLYLIMIFHLLTCIWIYVGENEGGWIDALEDEEEKNS